MLVTWARGGKLGGKRGKAYRCVLEFPQACGIGVGTPVRIRGVPVGSVVSVESTLAAVSVQCEIRDASTVIPRNALIEANQSGLIAEPLIDITPRDPVPDPLTLCPPTDQAGCEAQGAIVCQNGRIAGVTGVAMDDLVGVMTRMAKKMEAAGGVERVLDAAELASAALEDGRPLLATAAALAGEALPLIARLREGGLVGNLEQLTETAAAAAADVRALQGDVLTPDNVAALRSSVRVLARTLEHVEGVARDVGGLTGDARVRGSLKQLIEALSRIVAD
jgi:ABC-type transporter Mla subunit MlaD